MNEINLNNAMSDVSIVYDYDYANMWSGDNQEYSYNKTKKVLKDLSISHIEKYLREKKLENINKNNVT